MKRNQQKDLRTLADAFYSELIFEDGCEYGTPGLDCKRPFGNGDVEGDILDILGWEPEGDDGDDVCYSRAQKEYARALYVDKLVPYLKEQWSLFKELQISSKQNFQEEDSELMVTVPLELLKSVLVAAEDNNLDCLNDHLDKNAGYMKIGKNMMLKKMYEDEKAKIDKLREKMGYSTVPIKSIKS